MTEPATRPRTFGLIRDHDVTGISGTGRVADGVLWPDGTVSVRWRGDRPSVVHWGGLDDVEHVHGHGGHTRIAWDDEPFDEDLPCMHCPDGHPSMTSRPWGVRVSPRLRPDGKPEYLIVQPSAGGHVANEDARALWRLIRAVLDKGALDG